MYIEVNAHTTLEEVKNLWPIIKYHQKKYWKSRSRNTTNYFPERNKLIFKLKEKKVPNEEIRIIVKKELGLSVDDKQIEKIYHETKKKIYPI